MATKQEYKKYRVNSLPTSGLSAGDTYALNVGGGKYQTYVVSDSLQLTKEAGADFLEKDTVAELRAITAREIWAIQNGHYKGVKLNGYYVKGDTPTPIDYYISATSATDDGGSVIAVGGIKFEHVFKGAVDVRYYGAKAGGVDDCSIPLQKIIDYGYKTIKHKDGIYLYTNPVGLLSNNLYSENSFRFLGDSAVLNIRGNFEFLTSKASLSNPSDTANLYTGKVFIKNLDINGNGTSTLVNGDRVYNIFIQNCSIKGLASIVKSFRTKAGGYPDGYIQSLSILDNHITGVGKIIDAKRAYNVNFSRNMCEACSGGIYINGNGQPSVASLRIRDNLWESSGLFVHVTAVHAGGITGNYLEQNGIGDTSTMNCHIRIEKLPTGSYTSGFNISENTFQSTESQKTNTNWTDIKIDTSLIGTIGNTEISNNWTNSYALVNPTVTQNLRANGSTTAGALMRALSPVLPNSSRKSYFNASKQFLSSVHLSGGVHTICELSVSTLKNMIVGGSSRPFTGKINCLLQMKTSGGVVTGTTYVTIGIVGMSASEGIGGGIDDVYINGKLEGLVSIPAGLSTTASIPDAKTLIHFNDTTSTLSVTRDGDLISFKLSNYTAGNMVNFGSPNQILSHIVVDLNTMNNSNNMHIPLTVS